MGQPQERFRISGHLLDAAEDYRKKHSLEHRSRLHRAALRLGLLCPELLESLVSVDDDEDVAGIVDEIIAEKYASGISIFPPAVAAWVNGAAAEARARAAKEDRFWLIIGTRKLGPHRLELLQQWVAMGVLDDRELIQPEHGKGTMPIGFYPSFWTFAPHLQDRLDRLAKAVENQPKHEPTSRQLEKLEFFGFHFDRNGLTKARAGQILDQWALMDPETEKRYSERP